MSRIPTAIQTIPSTIAPPCSAASMKPNTPPEMTQPTQVETATVHRTPGECQKDGVSAGWPEMLTRSRGLVEAEDAPDSPSRSTGMASIYLVCLAMTAEERAGCLGVTFRVQTAAT